MLFGREERLSVVFLTGDWWILQACENGVETLRVAGRDSFIAGRGELKKKSLTKPSVRRKTKDAEGRVKRASRFRQGP